MDQSSKIFFTLNYKMQIDFFIVQKVRVTNLLWTSVVINEFLISTANKFYSLASRVRSVSLFRKFPTSKQRTPLLISRVTSRAGGISGSKKHKERPRPIIRDLWLALECRRDLFRRCVFHLRVSRNASHGKRACIKAAAFRTGTTGIRRDYVKRRNRT